MNEKFRPPTVEEVIAKILRSASGNTSREQEKLYTTYDINFWSDDLMDQNIKDVKVLSGDSKMWVRFLYCLLTPIDAVRSLPGFGSPFLSQISDFTSEDRISLAWQTSYPFVKQNLDQIQNWSEPLDEKIDTSKISIKSINFENNKVTIQFDIVSMTGKQVSENVTKLVMRV